MVDVHTHDQAKEYLVYEMRIYEEHYDVEVGQFSSPMKGLELVDEAVVYEYCKYVVIQSKMENEIPIICLIYIERLLTKTGILMNYSNWRKLTLISLCIASKIWDDDSLENVHFPKVMPDVTLKEINELERTFLELINYDLVIKGSEYAKYYFILTSIAQETERKIRLKKLSEDRMAQLEQNCIRLESSFKAGPP